MVALNERRRLGTVLLVATGVCVATLSALVAIGAFTMVHARADRVAGRAFLTDYETARPDAWVATSRMPYGDRMMLRVDIALSEHPPPVSPGLARWPRPGESMVSPAFRRESSVPGPLTRYAPARVVGPVTAAGLLAPDELVVYRGVPRERLPKGGQPVVARGQAPRTALSLDSLGLTDGQLSGLLGMFVVGIGLSLVSLGTVAARLSAHTRSRRLASLHVLGVPRSALRTITGLELVIPGLAGTLAGLALFPWVNVTVADQGMVGTRWFPSDTSLTPRLSVATVVIVVAFVAAAARRADTPSRAGAGRYRRTSAPRWPLWRVAPLCGGLAILSGLVAGGLRRRAGSSPLLHLDVVTLIGVVLSGIGLIMAFTPGAHLIGRLVNRRARGLAARVAGARSAFDPGAVSRVVVGAAVLVFAIGVTIGQTRDARAVSTPQQALVDVSLVGEDIPSADALSRLRSEIPLQGVWMIQSQAPSGRDVTTMVATCDAVRRFVRARPVSASPPVVPFSCRQGAVYWSDEAGEPGGLGVDRSGDRDQAMSSTMQVLLGVDGLDTRAGQPEVALRPPLAGVGSGSIDGGASLVFRTPKAQVSAVLGSIIGNAPYGQPSVMGLDPDSGMNIAMINGFIRLALLISLCLSGVALLTGLVDRASERRRADHELMAVGASRQFVRRVHRWELGLTLGAGLVTALVGGVLGGLAWQLGGGLVRTPDVPAILLLLALTTAAAIATVVLAERAAPARLDPTALRQD